MGFSIYNGYCPLDVIQSEITQKRVTGKIVLSRDWNSHTGCPSDNTENVPMKQQRWCEIRSMDKTKKNTYDRKLTEFCKNNEMLILNGRANSECGNISDGFTCFKYKGPSIVDYTVAGCSVLRRRNVYLTIKNDKIKARKSTQYNTLYYYKWDIEKLGYIKVYNQRNRANL